MRVQAIVRTLLVLGAGVVVACGFGKDATAGLFITLPEASSASYEILGFANGPGNKLDLKSGPIAGTTSAVAIANFDSKDGFSGQAGASTSLSHTIGFNNLTVTSSIASSMLFQNISPVFPFDFPNALSQVTVTATSQMQFHTDEAGKALVSWDLATSKATVGPWQSLPALGVEGSHFTSTFVVFTRNDFADFSTLTAATGTTDIAGELQPFTLSGVFGPSGNTIDIDLAPGDYTILTSTQTVFTVEGPGFYLNPHGSRIDTTIKIVTDAIAPVPEPGSLSLALCGAVGVAGVMAARRRK